MKNITFFLMVLFSIITPAPVQAGGGGMGIGGATETTQMMNNMELAQQYAKQLQQYATQLQQYQVMLQNLMKNNGGAMSTDIQGMISQMGGIMSAEQSMGSTMAQIDGNFAQRYKNPTAQNYSDRFNTWTVTSQDTLGASMKSAGLRRDSFASETERLNALYEKSQSSGDGNGGEVAAIQQLSGIATAQVQQTQALSALMVDHNEAAGAWMATQNAKEKALYDANNKVMRIAPREMPTPTPWRKK